MSTMASYHCLEPTTFSEFKVDIENRFLYSEVTYDSRRNSREIMASLYALYPEYPRTRFKSITFYPKHNRIPMPGFIIIELKPDDPLLDRAAPKTNPIYRGSIEEAILRGDTITIELKPDDPLYKQ